MIQRYMSPEMGAIFSDSRRYELWRLIEMAVVDAYAAEGVVDWAVADTVRATPAPAVAVIESIEQEVGHDVVAFLLAWTRGMPTEAGAAVHRGLTSSDIVDTALSLQVKQASSILLAELDKLVATLRDHALDHRDTVRVGRTHGQAATVDSWGHRVADFAFAAARSRVRLGAATEEMRIAKLSGPTGSYEHVTASVEARVASSLGLRTVEVATQVVMRDRLAAWMSTLALTASVCEAIATEVRLGAQSSVGEFTEGRRAAQAGSSAMPHKTNPIAAERVCGLARVVRGYVTPVMEGVALWHERDITHSSVERVCIPDAASLVEYSLRTTAALMQNLVVHTSKMAANITEAGAVTSSHAALVALTDAGLSWEDAWKLVKEAFADSVSDPEAVRATLAAAASQAGADVAVEALKASSRRRLSGLDAMFARLATL